MVKSRWREAGPGGAAALGGSLLRANTGPRAAAGAAAGAKAGAAARAVRGVESRVAGTAGWLPTGGVTVAAAGVSGGAAAGAAATGSAAGRAEAGGSAVRFLGCN